MPLRGRSLSAGDPPTNSSRIIPGLGRSSWHEDDHEYMGPHANPYYFLSEPSLSDDGDGGSLSTHLAGAQSFTSAESNADDKETEKEPRRRCSSNDLSDNERTKMPARDEPPINQEHSSVGLDSVHDARKDETDARASMISPQPTAAFDSASDVKSPHTPHECVSPSHDEEESPGNTSLSSKDMSPRRKYQIHYDVGSGLSDNDGSSNGIIGRKTRNRLRAKFRPPDLTFSSRPAAENGSLVVKPTFARPGGKATSIEVKLASTSSSGPTATLLQPPSLIPTSWASNSVSETASAATTPHQNIQSKDCTSGADISERGKFSTPDGGGRKTVYVAPSDPSSSAKEDEMLSRQSNDGFVTQIISRSKNAHFFGSVQKNAQNSLADNLAAPAISGSTEDENADTSGGTDTTTNTMRRQGHPTTTETSAMSTSMSGDSSHKHNIDLSTVRLISPEKSVLSPSSNPLAAKMAREFLSDLKVQSVGAVEIADPEEDEGLLGIMTETEDESEFTLALDSNDERKNHASSSGASRTKRAPPSIQTMENPSKTVERKRQTSSSTARTGGSDTINMTLSASGDDDYHERSNTDCGNEVALSVAESARGPLGGLGNKKCDAGSGRSDQEHSAADDEKTLERPGRKRIYSSGGKPAPRHRRTRSGDHAAATLMTGGTDWIGMELDKLPLPEDHDDDDDDDDNHSNNPKKELYEEVSPHRNGNYGRKSGGSSTNGSTDHSPSRSSVVEAKGGIMTGKNPTRWPGRRRQIPKPKTPGSVKDPRDENDPFTLSDSTMDEDSRMPKGTGWKKNASKTVLATVVERSSPMEVPTVVSSTARYQDSVSTLGGGHAPKEIHMEKADSSRTVLTDSDNESYTKPLGETKTRPMSPATPTTTRLKRDLHDSLHSTGASESSHSSQGSKSSTFSWISKTLSVISGKVGLGVANSSRTNTRDPMGNSAHSLEDESAADEIQEDSLTDVETNSAEATANVSTNILDPRQKKNTSPYPETDEAKALMHSDDGSYFQREDAKKKVRDEEKRRLRAFETHVKSLSTAPAMGKFIHSTFVSEEEAQKYPTFVCPNCRTRQREFFSVDSAPGQFESPAGYLAVYFSIYVIASLFIFGLEEGWHALDCVYFSVITLTTTGLGDLVPSTDGGKIICSIFIYFGVACIGLLLGSLLASGLDDASRKVAKKNLVENCPHCARLDAASREYVKTSKGDEWNRSNSKAGHWSPGHSNVMKPQTHSRTVVENNESGSNMVNRRSGTTGRVQKNSDAFEVDPLLSRERAPLGVISSWGGTGLAGNQLPSPMMSEHGSQLVSPASNFTMESTAAHEIVRRQSHTRHYSFDVNNFGQMGNDKLRNLSGMDGTRGIPDEKTSLTSNAGTVQYSQVHTEDSDYGSDSSSSYLSSSSEEDFLQAPNKIKAAKYVFLTLKQAVANSIFIIAIGSVGFYFIEKMTPVNAFYFTTVLLTTVGYGDLKPETPEGKMFAIVYVLVAGTVLLHNMSLISMIPLELRKRRIERAVLSQFGDQLNDAALRELATGPLVQRLKLSADRPDGLDECTREMFALAMLVRLGRISERDVKSTFAAFRRLDVDNDGKLNSREIVLGEVEKRRRAMLRQSEEHAEARRREASLQMSYNYEIDQFGLDATPLNQRREVDNASANRTHFGGKPPASNDDEGSHLQRRSRFASTGSLSDSIVFLGQDSPGIEQETTTNQHPSLPPRTAKSSGDLAFIKMANQSASSLESLHDVNMRARIFSHDSQFSALTSDLEMGHNEADYQWMQTQGYQRTRRRANYGSTQDNV